MCAYVYTRHAHACICADVTNLDGAIKMFRCNNASIVLNPSECMHMSCMLS